MGCSSSKPDAPTVETTTEGGNNSSTNNNNNNNGSDSNANKSSSFPSYVDHPLLDANGKLTKEAIVRRTLSSPVTHSITVGTPDFPIQIEVRTWMGMALLEDAFLLVLMDETILFVLVCLYYFDSINKNVSVRLLVATGILSRRTQQTQPRRLFCTFPRGLQ